MLIKHEVFSQCLVKYWALFTSIIANRVTPVTMGSMNNGSGTVRSVIQPNPPIFRLSTGRVHILRSPMKMEANIGTYKSHMTVKHLLTCINKTKQIIENPFIMKTCLHLINSSHKPTQQCVLTRLNIFLIIH